MISDQALREELVRYCQLSYDRRLVSGTGGNLSARIGDSETFLITPSQISLREINIDTCVTVDIKGSKIAGPDQCVPSEETLMHVAVYATHPEIRAIAHLHPPHCVSFAVRGEEIPLVTVTAEMRLGRSPVVPLASSGTRELAEAVEKTLAASDKNTRMLVLEKHGVVSFGETIQETIDVIDLAEETATSACIIAYMAGVRDH